MTASATPLSPETVEVRCGRSLLLVGGPAAGKTVYGTQLLGRMEVNQGALRLREAVGDLLPFHEAFERLASGFAPEHTGVSVYHELTVPVLAPGNVAVDLVWPDYGGEQVHALVEQRLVTPEWRDRVQTSAGWILMVRLDQLRTPDDLLTRPAELLASSTGAEILAEPGGDIKNAPGTPPEFHAGAGQAALIELLQILRFIKGVSALTPVDSPPLMILLSCWDELPEAEEPTQAPIDVLQRRLPLFSEFVAATWRPDAITVLGLSSQGHRLRSDEPDPNYVARGPEQFGYVVLEDGRRSADLTIPIMRLLQQIEAA